MFGIVAVASSPTIALAQERAEEAAGSPILAVNPGLIIWTWVLFLLTLGVLAWKVFPAISGGLEARHEKIQASIDEAHQARDDAKAMMEQQRSALDEARREAQEMIETARAAAEGTRKEILAEAKVQQEALLADARSELDQERDRLREDLRRETVEIALAAAERLIRVKLDFEENRRLVEELVADL
ncbi:MAG: F0F1 ATP synthase subunit B [Gemmatimonadota bacterium]